MIQTNLYDEKLYFAIIKNERATYIIEPSGWDKIKNRIPRDPVYLAFWSDFLEDKFGMLFTFIKDGNLTGGAQLLKDTFETDGENAEIFFAFGVMNFNTPDEINRWRINLKEYTEDFGGVGTSIEKMPFQGKLRSRMSSVCTVNDYATADGETLTPISTWRLRLHSKTLLKETRSLSPLPQLSNERIDSTQVYYIAQPDQTNLVPNELNEVFNQPFGFSFTGSATDPATSSSFAPPSTAALHFAPFNDQISQYTAKEAGSLNIKWSGSVDFYYYKYTIRNAYSWNITPRLVIQRAVAGILTIVEVIVGTTQQIGGVISGGTTTMHDPFSIIAPSFNLILPSVTGTDFFGGVLDFKRNHAILNKDFTWNESFSNVTVEAGDNIYVQMVMCPFDAGSAYSTDPVYIQFDNFLNDITYNQLTTTPGTISNGYRVFDVLNQQLENITGQKNSLISKFFSEGGAGYKFLLANGYGIRNYGGNIYMPKKSPQELINDLIAIHCLGAGVKYIDGVEYFVIDELDEFFKDRTIKTFHETFNWKVKNSGKYSFNKIQLGYNKHEGLNIIQQDEFNTESETLIPSLVYTDMTLNKKTNLIGSGYLIEEQRRNQFLANPGQKLTNDDDMFYIAVTDPVLVWEIFTVQFINGLSQISFNVGSMALQPGDTIVVTASTGGSGANIGTTFTIVSEVEGYPIIGGDAYNVTPAPVNDITFNNIVQITPPDPSQVFAERNQCFEICTNVTDPSTIYNGRISLKHILFNWRPFLGVGMYFSDGNAEIVTTLSKMNSLFTSKFLSTEPFKGNAGDLTLVEINRETIRNYKRNGVDIFTPISATCQVKVGWNDLNIIRKALPGELGDDSKDNGGLVLKDDTGVYWFCHVIDLQHNPVNQIADLEVQKVYKVTPI